MTRNRRQFLQTLGATGVMAGLRDGAAASVQHGVARAASSSPGPLAGPTEWRRHFPSLNQSVHGRPLIYLDSAATTLRPRAVIEAIANFYEVDNANPSRSLHTLARRAAERLDAAREAVARFIHAASADEVVFVRGTTEGINLVAVSWGSENLRAGDEIIVTIAEHYSNLLPWRLAARRAGAKVHVVEIDDQGRLRLEQLDALLSERTKLVAVSHVSNVLGLINPVKEICDRARRAGAKVFIDAAQSVPHLPVDVQALGCDFLAFSSHKMLGPMGVGVLWARRAWLESMPPYQAGSNMAHEVDRDSWQYEHGALKFQAGTPNVSGPIGLAAALRFLETIGREALWAHDQALTRHALDRFKQIDGLRLLGAEQVSDKIPVFTFVMEGVPVQTIVKTLDEQAIAVRGGDLAALPLLKRLGVSEAARASLYLYNTSEEVSQLAEALRALRTSSPGRARF